MSKAEKITLACIAAGILGLGLLYSSKFKIYSSSNSDTDPDAPVWGETDFNADGSNYNAHGSKYPEHPRNKANTKKKLTLNNFI